ncbi:MAG TPA: hypothetical protein VN541_09530 [Tepidisphaeraceae bacterium]|nr:hypothetical protein [Tepidisphaeraceae bacterium]
MILDVNWLPIVSMRWLHVISACLVVGGAFFLAFLVPWATTSDAASEAEPNYQRSRRGFKMVVHTTLLLLLASGIYNAMGYWGAYKLSPRFTHPLFGMHLLFGLTSFAILLVVLGRRQPRYSERVWVRYTAILLLITVLAASSLKYVREHPQAQTTRAAALNSR